MGFFGRYSVLDEVMSGGPHEGIGDLISKVVSTLFLPCEDTEKSWPSKSQEETLHQEAVLRLNAPGV